ncbi:alpha/beta hydrolase [Arthrobacter castelli]|uniref:alpha/beta hydrolase n=1 Tax=Arthrobacter castelli TaxID=271431 RepID=UPI0004101C84|nr:alpha/beta hydrolase [Arthrobacter castelli]
MPKIPRRHRAAAAVAACGLLLVTACTPFSDGGSAPPETMSAPPEVLEQAPERLMEFYSQSIEWEPCAEDFHCSTVKVPMDYENPDGKTLKIDITRAAATGSDPMGSILVNPGGPGGSGIDAVQDNASGISTDRLRESYNLIGFDPRGVKRSSPVECLSDKERDKFRAEIFDVETKRGLAKARASAEDYASQCAKHTGQKLGFFGTESAARDMDIIRAVLGEKKLDYLGFSYGTLLGATYAEFFPKTVGRMVLDGGIDPSITSAQMTLGQAKAFEDALLAYAKSCLQQQKCPLNGSPEQAVGQIRQLIKSVEASPMTAKSGRTVTAALFVSGLILPLYNDANWPALTAALQAAFQGDPTPMLKLADLGASRQDDGDYTTNSSAAFTAVNCLDYPMNLSVEQMRQNEEQLDQASPTLGRFLAYGAMSCNAWPYDAEEPPEPIHAKGAPPIVVVGTTGDPATPYQWSKALAKQLQSGVLLTWEGQGHTAYGRGSECIADAVDNYFIEGTVPDDGTRC